MLDIIRYIWSAQGGEYAFVAERRSGKWIDHPVSAEDPEFPDLSSASDWFWTPLTFVEPQRSNDTAAPARVLFADLDPVDPRDLSLPPTAAWESSPGSYQALWLVLDHMGYSRFANLNKRLTMLTGADQGGWMGSKVLRIPGTLNHKYDPPAPGKLLWWEPTVLYGVPELEERLPAIPNRPDVGVSEYPDLLDDLEYDDLLAAKWEDLSLSTRAMLSKPRVPDRSLHIVRTINALLSDGVSPEDAFQLIWWRPWCKWRTDRYRPDQLWAEVCRAQIRAV